MHSGSEKVVTFDMKNSATIGKGATSTVELVVSNSTNVNQTALTFSSKVIMESPTYMTNFVFYPSIERIAAADTKLTQNAIGLNLNATALSATFQAVLNDAAHDFNVNYKMGWPMANLDPRLGMITGLLKNATLSTSVTDHYMMMGLEMQADLPTAVAPEVEEFALKFLE